jgi:hypothetical protein
LIFGRRRERKMREKRTFSTRRRSRVRRTDMIVRDRMRVQKYRYIWGI